MKDDSYLLIKHDGEVLGIFRITIDEHFAGIADGSIFSKFTKAFGCTGWTPQKDPNKRTPVSVFNTSSDRCSARGGILNRTIS